MKKSTLFMLGLSAGAATVLVVKAARPLGAHAIAGGMIAFETACDAAEGSRDALSASARKIQARVKEGVKTARRLVSH